MENKENKKRENYGLKQFAGLFFPSSLNICVQFLLCLSHSHIISLFAAAAAAAAAAVVAVVVEN